MTDIRNSPSGKIKSVGGGGNTDDIENVSDVPGVNASDAFDYLLGVLTVTAGKILGRSTAGVVGPITPTGGVELSDSNLQRSALTGDVSAAAGSNTTSFASGDFQALSLKTTSYVAIGSGTLASAGQLRVNDGFVCWGRNSSGAGVDVPLWVFDGTVPYLQLGCGNLGGMTAFIVLNQANLQLKVGTNAQLQVTSTKVSMLINMLAWANTVVTNPTITQDTSTAGSGVGQTMSIGAQSCTGATSTGGALDMAPGAGTTTGGLGRCLSGGTTPGGGSARYSFNNTGHAFFAATPVAQAARVGQLTDNSGGTAGNTLPAIGVVYSQTEVRDSIASLAAKINGLELLIKNNGLSA